MNCASCGAACAMCELLGMSSNRLATLNLSLTKLAAHGGLTGSHKDGWGVGYYEGFDVRLIKEAEAAAGSDWINFLEQHDLRSQIVMAHIRTATMGDKVYRNTQPFARELAGRMHLFAHNGWLPGINDSPLFKLKQFHPVGETDSEVAFCALLDRLSGIWIGPGEIPSQEVRMAILLSFAAELRVLGPANFLYSDGQILVGHGHRRKQASGCKIVPPGLVYLHRHCRRRSEVLLANGVTVEGVDQTMTLLASVPLTDEPWQPMGEGELAAVCNGEVTIYHPNER